MKGKAKMRSEVLREVNNASELSLLNQNEIPIEILDNIFWRLDIITATSFSLASKKLRQSFLGNYGNRWDRHLLDGNFRAFKVDNFGNPLKDPENGNQILNYLPLNFVLPIEQGGPLSLRSVLLDWLPAELSYDCFSKRYLTAEGLQLRLLVMKLEAQERVELELEERETRHNTREMENKRRKEKQEALRRRERWEPDIISDEDDLESIWDTSEEDSDYNWCMEGPKTG